MSLAIDRLSLRPRPPLPCARPQPRAIVLALIGFSVAGCSAQPAPFNDDPRPQASSAGAVHQRFGQAQDGSWSWDGGVAITVARGETVDTIARRHHVPAAVIIQANNLKAPNALRPGQHLVVPRYITSPIPAAPRSNVAIPVPPQSIPTSGGETEIASGADVRVLPPESRPSRNTQAETKSPLKAANAKPKEKPAPERQAAAPAAHKPPVPKPAEPPTAVAAIKPESAPRFRWPVRGQLIAGFGAKADGQRNDGIDIAVPENTPIKAADDGVVIYSGNQLKAFGNLVLVRHNNNYVTAYAHAKELRVKQGDQIKAGEIIATSGQTGNAGAPELHFEIRQGSTPLDPTRLLHGT